MHTSKATRAAIATAAALLFSNLAIAPANAEGRLTADRICRHAATTGPELSSCSE